jgi:UDP:flavonoid glycosyltransferase YjiC (YdhE family)
VAGKSVLFLPINVLSSVTRQIACARAFREKGFSVHFGGKGDYLEMAAGEGFPVHDLLSLEPERLLARLRTIEKSLSSLLQFAKWAWKELDLERFVQQEVHLFQQIEPSMIISEERVSAVLSAKIVGCPHSSLRNAYRTPYSVFPLMDLSDTIVPRIIPDPGHAQYLLLKFFSRPFLWRMSRLLRSYGIREPMTFDEYIESDDMVFLCDVPEFSPAGILPASHHYVGPLFWEKGGNRPPWLNDFSPSDRVVYVSLGSTGTPELLQVIVRALRGHGYRLVVTCGIPDSGSLETDFGEGVYVERFMDAGPVLEKASAVLCHAGNGTVYQALASGVPVIGIPTHLEQRFNAQRVEALGLGRNLDLRLLKDSPEMLLTALQEIQDDPFLQESIRRFQKRILGFHAPHRIVELTEAFLRAREGKE